MKKYSREKATGKVGVTFVANVISKSGSIFREISEDTDVGIDGYIEFVDDEIATGNLVGVQIKSGSSYFVDYSDAKYFIIRTSKEDINYWNSQPIPIALIVFDPVSGLSGWIDITGYIRQNPQCLEHKHTKITIHGTANPFTEETFESKFKKTFTSYRQEADLFTYANLVASNDNEQKFQGFVGLLNNPLSRFSELTCYLLINHLSSDNKRIRTIVTDSTSRYLSHPEYGFVPPRKISDYVNKYLNKFGLSEIVQLLETAWMDNENLMQRGSLGQSAGVIIINVPNFALHLYDIISKPKYTDEVRTSAIALISEFHIEETIELIVKNFSKIHWGNLKEYGEWILEIHDAIFSDFREIMADVSENDNYDNPELLIVLKEASKSFLNEFRYLIYQIVDSTNDPCIKLEAQHALHRIMNQSEYINGMDL